jgi:nickel-dependent lactate racemase
LKKVVLQSGAWLSENSFTIDFPADWELMVLGERDIPPLTKAQIRKKIIDPIKSPRLSSLAESKKNAVIIIDDISRPTPTSLVLPIIIAELNRGGINNNAIKIIVAGGTHKPATKEEIIKKAGAAIVSKINVFSHDCRRNLVYLGKTSRGTPLYVNKDVVESELKIGVGGIYPHPSAGFSGGSKIVMPGVMGIETTRNLHDYVPGTYKRGEIMDSDFNREVEEAAALAGLDFIVNVVLNQRREIAGVFSGDRVIAHQSGVEFAREVYSVNAVEGYEVIVSDTYPFDSTLYFARDRGFWPFMGINKKSTKVLIAESSTGLGDHELNSISSPIWSQIVRRIKKLRFMDLQNPVSKIKKIKKIFSQKREEFLILSKELTKEEVKSVYPGAALYEDWKDLLRDLMSRHKEKDVKVVVYRCAPLLVPSEN